MTCVAPGSAEPEDLNTFHPYDAFAGLGARLFPPSLQRRQLRFVNVPSGDVLLRLREMQETAVCLLLRSK